jgi:hypothetical protein
MKNLHLDGAHTLHMWEGKTETMFPSNGISYADFAEYTPSEDLIQTISSSSSSFGLSLPHLPTLTCGHSL